MKKKLKKKKILKKKKKKMCNYSNNEVCTKCKKECSI